MDMATDAYIREINLDAVGPSYSVLGVPVSVTSLDDATDRLIQWSTDERGRFVCIRDVHGVMRALEDTRVMAAHHAAALVTPDGMPVALIGKMRGFPVQRTTGADLMESALDKGRAHGLRHFFYGGAPGVGDLLKQKMEERFPGVQIVGTECPPFREPTPQETEDTRRAIIASRADIVWVGLSTPKQEYWMVANYKMLPATLIGVGAAYDFHSGRVTRAPAWMRRSGLEWLHRLCSEPRRLWRRYLVLAPKFLFLIAREQWSGRR